MSISRIILIIIDACGVGELPDSAQYGDTGAATIPNIAKACNGINIPNLHSLGLGNITDIMSLSPVDNPTGCYGKMNEVSHGKDSTTGHWEIGGINVKSPFPVFPNGFPDELVMKFEKLAGVETIGNCTASGTEIINRLGEEHLRTKKIILYTSADSVFQLAAHEDIYPLERQYEICQIARELLVGEYAVGRVIARPFIGEVDNFQRTSGRKDFSLEPTEDTILDLFQKNRKKVLSIGKIYDLYCGRGFNNAIKTKNNSEVGQQIIEAISKDNEHDLIFANFVDFDMNHGHRNDTEGFAMALEQFDLKLKTIMDSLRDDDMMIITADHGCDPTIKISTDHTREYVPLLVYGKNIKKGINLGIRGTFSDIACTLAEVYNIDHKFEGTSFYKDISED